MRGNVTLFFTVLLLVSVCSVSILGQEITNYNEDSHLVTSEVVTDPTLLWGESINAAGDWCAPQTYPDLPAATYFQAATWLGDTLYVHAPSTTGTPTTDIIKYTVGGSWNSGTALPVALTGGALVAAGGKLYYLGGGTTSVTTGAVNTVYEY